MQLVKWLLFFGPTFKATLKRFRQMSPMNENSYTSECYLTDTFAINNVDSTVKCHIL